MVQTYPVLFEEGLKRQYEILLDFEIVVVHIIWGYQFADFASAMSFERIWMRNVDEGVGDAVDYQDRALGVLDEIYVSVSVGEEVAEYLANPIFGNISKRFERRHENHAADIWPFLGYVAGWTWSDRSTKQNDILCSNT